MRTYFDIGEFDRMPITIGAETFSYVELNIFAEIANMPADIFEVVGRLDDGRFIYLTTASMMETRSPYGISKGWYTARFVDLDEAVKIRKSWSVLREQPSVLGIRGFKDIDAEALVPVR